MSQAEAFFRGWLDMPTKVAVEESTDIYIPHTGTYEANGVGLAYDAVAFRLDLSAGTGTEIALGYPIKSSDPNEVGDIASMGVRFFASISEEPARAVGIDDEEGAAYIHVALVDWDDIRTSRWHRLPAEGGVETEVIGEEPLTGTPWLWRSRVHWRWNNNGRKFEES